LNNCFLHFSEARRNPRVQILLNRFGIAGYGVYFFLLECAMSKPDGRLKKDYRHWAAVCETSIPLVKGVVEESYLFELLADSFKPISVNECVEF